MNNVNTQSKGKELAVTYEVDGNKVILTPSVVQKYIVGTDSPITIQEFKFFSELCKAIGLNPEFDGIESGVIVIKDDNITERKGCFVAPNENLVGGWAKVYRKNWTHPTYCSVGLEEVASRKKDGSLNSMWASKPATMVEKVAKVRALRETFIENLGGLYDADEVEQNNAVDVPEPQNVIDQDEPQEVVEMATEQPQQIGFDDL